MSFVRPLFKPNSVRGEQLHTCFLAQQPSGFQHATSLQAALDGSFFLFPCVSNFSNYLPAHGIIYWQPDKHRHECGDSKQTTRDNEATCKLLLTLSCRARCHDFCLHTRTPVLPLNTWRMSKLKSRNARTQKSDFSPSLS